MTKAHRIDAAHAADLATNGYRTVAGTKAIDAIILEEKDVDVRVRNEGTLFLFDLLTDAADDWVKMNVSDESQMYGGALVVEHRYARDIAAGMQSDGLVVK